MKDIFTSDDFVYRNGMSERTITDHANRIVKERIFDKGVRVTYREEFPQIVVNHKPVEGYDTHRAMLINIEPIEKPKCVEHEPSFTENGYWREPKNPAVCKHCGVKLKAVWQEE